MYVTKLLLDTGKCLNVNVTVFWTREQLQFM